MSATIVFYGGAGSVTGSNFLLNTGSQKILIDCGLQQGTPDAEETNWKPFAYTPADIDILFITHAHIDHVGRVPKLVKDGFKGRIISTAATKALAHPMLYDAVEITAAAAKHHNREELYTKEDIEAAMKLWETAEYHKPLSFPECEIELLNSGHILGSAMVRFTRNGKSILFTGDLGGGNSPLIPLAETAPGVTYLIMESVYGDKHRPEDVDRKEQLEDVIENAAVRGGTLLIPAFSAERTQDLIYEIRDLMMSKKVPTMPVYLDSPLAEKLTEAYIANASFFITDIAARIQKGEHIFAFPELRYIQQTQASRELEHAANPKIIIAGSGMSTGGRGLFHERYVLPDPRSTVLVCGYQAAGSLGRRLIEKSKSVEIWNENVSVKCHIEQIYGYSAHMDGEELLEFANAVGPSLQHAFVVMGEPGSSMFLAQRIRDYLGVRADVPEAGDSVQLDW